MMNLRQTSSVVAWGNRDAMSAAGRVRSDSESRAWSPSNSNFYFEQLFSFRGRYRCAMPIIVRKQYCRSKSTAGPAAPKTRLAISLPVNINFSLSGPFLSHRCLCDVDEIV